MVGVAINKGTVGNTWTTICRKESANRTGTVAVHDYTLNLSGVEPRRINVWCLLEFHGSLSTVPVHVEFWGSATQNQVRNRFQLFIVVLSSNAQPHKPQPPVPFR